MSEYNKGEKNPNWGKTHSEETRKKISEKVRLWWSTPENRNKIKGRVKSEEFRKKMSESHKGERNYMFGKHHSKKTKGKIRSAHLGKKHSEETRKKQSEIKKGKNNPMWGKIHSEETKEKQRQRMLNGGAARANSFIKNPSKPQVKLFELVKELYPEAELNYPVFEFNRLIDVCIPCLKIAIEYDEPYWHDLEQDEIRQTELETLGYRFIRYERRIPSLEELENDINNISAQDYIY